MLRSRIRLRLSGTAKRRRHLNPQRSDKSSRRYVRILSRKREAVLFGCS